MTQSPVVKFGMYALDVAYKAKTGRMKRGDRLALAVKALDSPCADASVRHAVTAFLFSVDYDPITAGGKLQDFIIAWAAKLVPDTPFLDAARPGEHDLFGPECGVQDGLS